MTGQALVGRRICTEVDLEGPLIWEGVESACPWKLARGEIWGRVKSAAGWNLGRGETWGGLKPATG